MKRIFLFAIFMFSVTLSDAKIEKQSRTLSFEEFTVCGDYADSLATFYNLTLGWDYWDTYFYYYGDCIERLY